MSVATSIVHVYSNKCTCNNNSVVRDVLSNATGDSGGKIAIIIIVAINTSTHGINHHAEARGSGKQQRYNY